MDESLRRACALIERELASGNWVSSNRIHQHLRRQVKEADFGRAKKVLEIEHRQVRAADGRMEYQWRLPTRRES